MCFCNRSRIHVELAADLRKTSAAFSRDKTTLHQQNLVEMQNEQWNSVCFNGRLTRERTRFHMQHFFLPNLEFCRVKHGSRQGCHFPDNMKFPDFSRPFRGVWGYVPQKIFRIRIFNLAENEFQTTKFPDFWNSVANSLTF